MRILIAGWIFVACCLSGCLKTEALTAEEMNKYPRPSPEQFKKVDTTVTRQPKPETCLEAGKMYETLAKSAPDVAQQRDFTWRAKQAYQQALRIKPNWPTALAGLARVEELEGNPQKAAEQFQLSLQAVTGKDPSDAVACHEAGLFFGRIKQFDLSLAAMQKAVQFEPSNRTYAMNYGYTLARAGRYDEGYRYFSQMMNPSEAAFQIAQMSQHLGDSERTRQFAGFALQQNPAHAQAQQLIAKLDQPATQQVQNVEQTPNQ